MNLTLRIPDELASRFASADEMERRTLEGLALDEFRRERLTRPELKQVFGFATLASSTRSSSAAAVSDATARATSTAIGPTCNALAFEAE